MKKFRVGDLVYWIDDPKFKGEVVWFEDDDVLVRFTEPECLRVVTYSDALALQSELGEEQKTTDERVTETMMNEFKEGSLVRWLPDETDEMYIGEIKKISDDKRKALVEFSEPRYCKEILYLYELQPMSQREQYKQRRKSNKERIAEYQKHHRKNNKGKDDSTMNKFKKGAKVCWAENTAYKGEIISLGFNSTRVYVEFSEPKRFRYPVELDKLILQSELEEEPKDDLPYEQRVQTDLSIEELEELRLLYIDLALDTGDNQWLKELVKEGVK